MSKRRRGFPSETKVKRSVCIVLVGVMFMVVIGTFEWASLKLYRKVPFTDFLVMVIVSCSAISL